MKNQKKKNIKNNKNSYHHGNLEDALIKAGLEILEEKGINALTLRAVARKVGVSHSAPYSHFSNKNELFAGIAQEGFKKLIKKLENYTNNFDGDYATLCKNLTWYYIKFAINNPDCYNLMFGGLLHESNLFMKDRSLSKSDVKKPNHSKVKKPHHLALLEISYETFNIIIKTIKKGQKLGLIKEGDPFLLAIFNWVSIHGLAILLINKTMPSPSGVKLCSNENEISKMLSDLISDNIYEGLRK